MTPGQAWALRNVSPWLWGRALPDACRLEGRRLNPLTLGQV
jgi:hypothetical protein